MPSLEGRLRELREALSAAGLASVDLVLTANRTRLVSVEALAGHRNLRVSRHLLELGPSVVEPIVAFAAGRRGARDRLRECFAALPPRPSRNKRLRVRGDHHDLAALLADESRARFGAELPVQITWAPRRRLRPRQRGLKLGAYYPNDRLIHIHPLLDQPDVPAWYLRFVIFHELLHYRLGCPHTPAFRAHERQHPDYPQVRALEGALVTDLLRRGYPPQVSATALLASAAPHR